MKLKGQKLIVMGGTSGVGLATAKLAKEQGASVIITGREADKAEAARVQIGPEAQAKVFDASDANARNAFFSEIGPFDHLILTLSGGKGAGPFASVTEGDLRAGFDAKFFLHWNLAQASLPTLRRDGSITFISAASARMGNPGTAGLAAINGAIQSLVEPLAAELKPLRVNAVSPGVIDTPWWHGLPDDQRRAIFEQSASASTVGRVGDAGGRSGGNRLRSWATAS